MKKQRRLLAAVLAVLFLLPLLCGVVSAEGLISGPITEEDHGANMLLTRLATTYVTKYVNTAFLYETEDLTENTILSLPEGALPAQLPLSTGTHSGSDLAANLSHFADLAEYFRYTRSEQDIQRRNFNLDISNIEVTVDGDTAAVDLFTHITFMYPDSEELTEFGDNYTIYFSKIGDKWYISDVISDELQFAGFNRETFNVQQQLEAFNNAQAQRAADSAPAIWQIHSSDDTQSLEILSSGTVQNLTAYNADNAIDYAFTYSTQSYTDQEGNNGLFLSGPFYDYSDEGGNCINYVSQCIWAGLGGKNTLAAIKSKEKPMDNTGSYVWYGGWRDENSSGPSSQSWRSVPYFRTYIQSLNSGEEGLMAYYDGYDEPLSASALLFANKSRSIRGAALIVSPSNTNLFGHAIILESASFTSSTTDEFIFCGNSPMRKHTSSDDFPNYMSGYAELVLPTFYRTVSNCTGHTYTPYDLSIAPSGSGAKCQKCDYSRLTVVADMWGPIAENSTITITAEASMECYRMAIAIKPPGEDSVNSWIEYLGVETVSRSYTFDETGLYTITISARDINSNTLATTAQHVFTIRVY